MDFHGPGRVFAGFWPAGFWPAGPLPTEAGFLTGRAGLLALRASGPPSAHLIRGLFDEAYVCVLIFHNNDK